MSDENDPASSPLSQTEPNRQKLWDFFVTNHDLHLLDSELNDIIHAVGAVIKAESLSQTDETPKVLGDEALTAP